MNAVVHAAGREMARIAQGVGTPHADEGTAGARCRWSRGTSCGRVDESRNLSVRALQATAIARRGIREDEGLIGPMARQTARERDHDRSPRPHAQLYVAPSRRAAMSRHGT